MISHSDRHFHYTIDHGEVKSLASRGARGCLRSGQGCPGSEGRDGFGWWLGRRGLERGHLGRPKSGQGCPRSEDGPKMGGGCGGGVWNAVILAAQRAGRDARGPKTVRRWVVVVEAEFGTRLSWPPEERAGMPAVQGWEATMEAGSGTPSPQLGGWC